MVNNWCEMGIISVKNLIHKFIDKDEDGNIVDEKMALNGVDLEVEKGQFIAILGHNGSGKSTFAKHLNVILYPTEGDVCVNGMNTKEDDNIWKIRQEAGMVFQNPDNQIIATVVEEDVGFGPENLGVETEEIWERVNKALEAVEMTAYRKHSPNKLSGGQKQRVAIAGVMAMKPECIILDEPTAMLDPNGRKEVIKTLHELNKKENVTIILVTHYMDEVIDADKVFVMDKGQVCLSGTPREVFSNVMKIKELGLDVPQVTYMAHLLKESNLPIKNTVLTIDELVDEIKEIKRDKKTRKYSNIENIDKNNCKNNTKNNSNKNNSDKKNSDSNNINVNIKTNINNKSTNAYKKDVILKVEDLTYLYAQGTNYEKKAIDNVSLKLYSDEFVGIIGHTGSGKSTLIQHLNGLIKPTEGKIFYKGKNIYDKDIKMSDIRKSIGIVFQYPEYQLFESTVLLDVAFGPINLGFSKEEAIEKAKNAMELVGIGEKYYERSPFELSGGEKRRVAIAGMLAMNPEILILDEPTAGLDPKGRDKILNLLKKIQKEQGIAVIVVSHSMEDMAKYSDRIIVMNKGKKIYDDIPVKVFRNIDVLESMGLAAPQVSYIMNRLSDEIEGIDTEIINVEEAVSNIVEQMEKSC